MKTALTEIFTPTDQAEKEDPKSYKIQALKPMELAEVNADGWEARGDDMRMNFKGVKALLKYGLVDQKDKENMSSVHLIEASNKIYQLSLLSETERKN